MRRIFIFVLMGVTLMWATTYTEPWTSSLDSWAFTQISCGGTCVNALVTTDGNPADSVSAKITGRSKAEVGYWSRAMTWEAMGVPAGDVVSTVDGQWDDKAVSTAIACTSSSTMGIQIFDATNTTEITSPSVEANLNVSGDTAAWTNHDPTGAVSVISSTASSSTVTLRFNENPASGNNSSAACELRGDNYTLTIVSAPPPSGPPHQLPTMGVGMAHVTQIRFGREPRKAAWHP
jgi:hypothetical protein